MRSVSFDVDGTLIDNKSLVRAAYEQAGVKLTDVQWENCFGKTFSEWLVEHCSGDYELAWAVHRRKNEFYQNLIRTQSGSEHVLSPTQLARELHESGCEPYIITGASNVAAVTVLDFLGLESIHPSNVTAALSIEGKISLVQELGTLHIDDDIRIVDSLRTIGYPYVVHYKIGDSLQTVRTAVESLWIL